MGLHAILHLTADSCLSFSKFCDLANMCVSDS